MCFKGLYCVHYPTPYVRWGVPIKFTESRVSLRKTDFPDFQRTFLFVSCNQIFFLITLQNYAEYLILYNFFN